MGKPAVNVSVRDERVGEDGLRHRVVHKSVGADGRVSIAYDVIRPSGGTSLRFETLLRTDVTDFAAPATAAFDGDDPA